jgi:hypothetical protein
VRPFVFNPANDSDTTRRGKFTQPPVVLASFKLGRKPACAFLIAARFNSGTCELVLKFANRCRMNTFRYNLQASVTEEIAQVLPRTEFARREIAELRLLVVRTKG